MSWPRIQPGRRDGRLANPQILSRRRSGQPTQLRRPGSDRQTFVDHARPRAFRDEDLSQRKEMVRRDIDRAPEAATVVDRNASIR